MMFPVGPHLAASRRPQLSSRIARRHAIAIGFAAVTLLGLPTAGEVPFLADAQEPAARDAAHTPLSGLALTEHADARQVRHYIRNLAVATAHQLALREHARGDAQQAMLEALAEDHMDRLIEAYEEYAVLRYYLEPIVREELNRRMGPNRDALAKLKFKPHGDADSAELYVNAIRRLTAAQQRLAVNDPQVTMLAALADDHFHRLVRLMEDSILGYHASLAVNRAAGLEHREIIIASLADQPRLLGVVIKHHWERDAREALIEGLMRGPVPNTRSWVKALVDLRDPSTYPALEVQLIRSRCNRATYNLLRRFTDMDLRPAVLHCWDLVARTPAHDHELKLISEIAALHGHTPAILTLIRLLPTEQGPDTPYLQRELRQFVLRYTAATGSNAELKEWANEHGDQLAFDARQRKYYVASGWH